MIVANGMVVDDLKMSPVGCQTLDRPVCLSAIDSAVSVSVVDRPLQLKAVEQSLGAPILCVNRPNKAFNRHAARGYAALGTVCSLGLSVTLGVVGRAPKIWKIEVKPVAKPWRAARR